MKFCTHAGVLVNDGRLSHHRDTSFFGGHPTSDPTRCGLAPVLLSSLTVLVVVQVFVWGWGWPRCMRICSTGATCVRLCRGSGCAVPCSQERHRPHSQKRVHRWVCVAGCVPVIKELPDYVPRLCTVGCQEWQGACTAPHTSLGATELLRQTYHLD